MSQTDPNIQRISLEEIQEFSHLDFYNLPKNEEGRLVVAAYDTVSKTFTHAYTEKLSLDSGEVGLHYGHADDIASFLIDTDKPNSPYRPSILGFTHGDGIIAEKDATIVSDPLVKRLDFYDVSIQFDDEGRIVDEDYVYKGSLIPVKGDQGIQGPKGDKGDKGDPGADGRDGTDGIVPVVQKSVYYFTRNNSFIEGISVVVSGGTYASPSPTTTTVGGTVQPIVWSDGIPTGTAKVWMIARTYYSNGTVTAWSTPSGITDTASIDFSYSRSILADPGTPSTPGNPGGWFDTLSGPTDDIIWMAHRTIENGVFSTWKVYRVKGETGAPGKGIEVQGRDTPCNILNKAGVPLYTIWLASEPATVAQMLTCSGKTMEQAVVVNDAFLRVPDGTGEGGSNWDILGNVTGTDGASFLYSIVFKRSVGVPERPSKTSGKFNGDFTNPVPDGWSDGMPAPTLPKPDNEFLYMTTRHFSNNAAANNSLADWSEPKIAGETQAYKMRYALKQPNDAVPLPPDQASTGIWTNNPNEVNYYWSATIALINGVEQLPWKVNRIKGETGAPGSDGESTFLSSAFTKTNDDISSLQVVGGSYANPLPTAGNGYTWTDGIPAGGTGAVWMVQVRFRQTDTGTPLKVWSNPSKIVDTAHVIFMFNTSETKPVADPVQGDTAGNNGWYATSEGINVVWMAIGSQVNGVWPTSWEVFRVKGESGAAGTAAYSYVPTSMFARCDNSTMAQTRPVGKYLTLQNGVYTLQGSDPSVVIGGSTYTFTDGIPDFNPSIFPNNSKRVWMIQGVLNSNDHLGPTKLYQWGNPQLLADSATIDFEYKAGSTLTTAGPQPAPPNGTGTDGWVSYPEDVPGGPFWVAQRNWSEGPGARWVVYQIRGEGGGTAENLTWRTFVIRDPRGNAEAGASTSGQAACDWGPQLSSTATVYHTGNEATPKVGDYISFSIAGDQRLPAGWYSNNYNVPGSTTYAFKVGSNGLITERHTCAVGGMGKPASPVIGKSNTNDMSIFISAAPVVSGSVVYKEHKIYADNTLIATIPHTGGELKYTWNYTGPLGKVISITSSSVDTFNTESPRSDVSPAAVCDIIEWYKVGQIDLNAIKTLYSNGLVDSTQKIPYYHIRSTTDTTIFGHTFYKSKIGPAVTQQLFDGQSLWYFPAQSGATVVTAYRMLSSGKVTQQADVYTSPNEIVEVSMSAPYGNYNICDVGVLAINQLSSSMPDQIVPGDMIFQYGTTEGFVGDIDSWYLVRYNQDPNKGFVIQIDANGVVHGVAFECEGGFSPV